MVDPGGIPGSWSSTYDSWIVKMQNAGISVIGYVDTDYAGLSISSVEATIAAWKQMYWVNGVFLDRMSNNPAYESYYSALTSYAHLQGLPMVVGNPGTSVPSGYIGTVDVLLVFENPCLPSLSRLETITVGQGSLGDDGGLCILRLHHERSPACTLLDSFLLLQLPSL